MLDFNLNEPLVEESIRSSMDESEYNFECERSDSLDDKKEKLGGSKKDYDKLHCKEVKDLSRKRDLTLNAETILSSLGDNC